MLCPFLVIIVILFVSVLKPAPLSFSELRTIKSRFFFSIFFTRITSYNVCYTKLLRLLKRDKQAASTKTTGGQTISKNPLELRTATIFGLLFVITSYSIHYTKLYDTRFHARRTTVHPVGGSAAHRRRLPKDLQDELDAAIESVLTKHLSKV